MKTSVPTVGLVLFSVILFSVSCGSQQTTEPASVIPQNPFVGAWKTVEVTITAPQAQTITDPLPGICIMSPKYMAYVGVQAPREALPENPTDAQLAAAFKPFMAIAASYESDGNTITAHPIVGSDPSMTEDTFVTMEYKLEGDYFTVTPKSNEKGPVENSYTLKFKRID